MSGAPEPLTAVLDANVRYPQWLRDVLLTLAAMGYYDPVWSPQIVEEMRRNVLQDHPDPHHFDETTIGALRRVFPGAWVRCPTDWPPRGTTIRRTVMSSPRQWPPMPTWW